MLLTILKKMQPAVRKDANYADLHKIKKEAVWSEEQDQWMLPELSFNTRGGLPTATASHIPHSHSDLSDDYMEDDINRESRLKKVSRGDDDYYNDDKTL